MKKGSHHSEESKRKIKQVRALQPSALIGRYGVTQQSYEAAMGAGLRWCRDCKAFFPPSLFYGEDRRCIECTKNRAQRWRERRTYRKRKADAQYLIQWRKTKHESVRRAWLKRYGVTPEWYDQQFSAQNGCCGICSRTKDEGRRYLCIDHDHETGKVRGLLCIRCNAFVSGFDDGFMERALAYLAKYKEAA